MSAQNANIARPNTPDQPEKFPKECPGAPVRAWRPAGLAVNTAPHGADPRRILNFEEPAPGAPIKKARISSELDMSAAQRLGF